MPKHEKYIDYAVLINSKISELFRSDEDDEGPQIDLNELAEGDNALHFLHALSTVVPTSFFNKLTHDEKNHLEFNHVANQLCFQFGTKE